MRRRGHQLRPIRPHIASDRCSGFPRNSRNFPFGPGLAAVSFIILKSKLLRLRNQGYRGRITAWWGRPFGQSTNGTATKSLPPPRGRRGNATTSAATAEKPIQSSISVRRAVYKTHPGIERQLDRFRMPSALNSYSIFDLLLCVCLLRMWLVRWGFLWRICSFSGFDSILTKTSHEWTPGSSEFRRKVVPTLQHNRKSHFLISKKKQ